MRTLKEQSEVTFRLSYTRQEWQVGARSEMTALRVSTAALVETLRGAGIDLATCQVVPLARQLVKERFSECQLSDAERDDLTRWALLPRGTAFHIVSAPPLADAQRSKLIAQPTGAPVSEQGPAVVSDGTLETLSRIEAVERDVVAEVDRMRAGGVVLISADSDEGPLSAAGVRVAP